MAAFAPVKASARMATVLRVRMVCDRLQVRAGVTTGVGGVAKKVFSLDTSRKIVFIRARLFAHTFPKHPKSLTDETTITVTSVQSSEGRKAQFWLGFG
jgi:hypothetical protein